MNIRDFAILWVMIFGSISFAFWHDSVFAGLSAWCFFLFTLFLHDWKIK